uniref:Uncharacterized protein n=1 Tax=Arundo donax TaxID=35708 RepID=A0A0A8Z3U0_ARUDO
MIDYIASWYTSTHGVIIYEIWRNLPSLLQLAQHTTLHGAYSCFCC